MEYETNEEGLLFDHSTSNPSLDHRASSTAGKPGGDKAQKGLRIPEEEDQLA